MSKSRTLSCRLSLTVDCSSTYPPKLADRRGNDELAKALHRKVNVDLATLGLGYLVLSAEVCANSVLNVPDHEPDFGHGPVAVGAVIANRLLDRFIEGHRTSPLPSGR